MRVDEAGLEWVRITNPNTNGEAEVSRESFDGIWANKGWELHESETAPASPVAGEPVGSVADEAVQASYDANTVEELEAEIDRRGLSRVGLTLKADLIKVLKADDKASS